LSKKKIEIFKGLHFSQEFNSDNNSKTATTATTATTSLDAYGHYPRRGSNIKH
jgi:hypothetical protein